MDNKPLIKPGKLFLICIALLAYAGLSVALVGGIGPALVSSRDDVLVFAGFAIPGVWLIASVCLGIHLANTRREEAATRGLGSNGTESALKPYHRRSVPSSQATASIKQLRMSASWLISVSKSCTVLSNSSSLR